MGGGSSTRQNRGAASLERGRNGFWGEDKCQGHDSNLERPFKVGTRGLRGHQALGGGRGRQSLLFRILLFAATWCPVVLPVVTKYPDSSTGDQKKQLSGEDFGNAMDARSCGPHS